MSTPIQPIPEGAEATADLMAGVRALDDTREAYLEANRYFSGEIPERFATPSIRAKIEASGKRYRFRFAHIPVNTVKRRCRIASISAENDGLQELIDRIREENQLETYEPWITERWLVQGDAYIMCWPVEEDDQASTVDISYQSPLTCRAFYDAEDGKEIRFVVRRWIVPTPLGDVWRAEVWYPDRMEPFATDPGATGTDPLSWHRYAEDDSGNPTPVTPQNWPVPNDWEEIPIKHLRTALPYGRPEHADAYGPQDAITKALVTQVVAGVESFGWRPRYRIADDTRALDTARDSIVWADESETTRSATNPDGTARGVESSRTGGPGDETVYRGTREVGTFEVPDPGQLNAPLEMWLRFMSTATETPLYEFDPESGNQLSGVSRDKADRPLKAKVDDRRRMLNTVWAREVWPLALRMAGYTRDPQPIEIIWVPPEVQTDPEWWTTSQIRLGLGVPLSQILTEAGYTQDQVTEWLDDQSEEAGLDQRIARVKALGDAMSSLGAAVSLNVVTPQGAEALLKRILKEAADGSTANAFPDPAELEARRREALQIQAGAREDDNQEAGESRGQR